ncbi:hypothetical protein D3C85_1271530 [compost metagenome]
MRGVLDVVAFDHQRAAANLDARHTGRTTGLVQVALVDQRVGLLQHRQHGVDLVAADCPQARKAALDTEQAAFTTSLFQVILLAPAAHLVHLLLQGFQRQRMLGVGQQVVHQQFFDERLQALG